MPGRRNLLHIASLLLFSLSFSDSFGIQFVSLQRGIVRSCDSSFYALTARFPTKAVRSEGAVAIQCSGTLNRKEKNRQKKQQRMQESVAKKEMQQKRDVLVEDLLDEIAEEKRDLGAIARNIDKLRVLRPAAVEQDALCGDWKLLYVNSADALHKFGTGLGKLPGTTILDAWITLTPENKVKLYEICRVIGPFPNIQNIMEGTWEYRERATVSGFAPAGSAEDNNAAGSANAPRGLRLSYKQLTDGRGKVTTADTGFRARDVTLDVAFWSPDVLILDSDSDGPLVWEREDQLEKEMGRLLRVDLTAPPAQQPASLMEGIAQFATAAKKPWDLFKR